jgi:hypothetical protein
MIDIRRTTATTAAAAAATAATCATSSLLLQHCCCFKQRMKEYMFWDPNAVIGCRELGLLSKVLAMSRLPTLI